MHFAETAHSTLSIALILRGLSDELALSASSTRSHPAWHSRCIFRRWSFLCSQGVSMRLSVRTICLGIALLLSTSAALAPTVLAQEASAENVKRKVKTKVVPEFPVLAKQMNVTGKVKIETTISADGRVTNMKVVGGSPLLVNSALDALKKWRFEAGPRETTEIVEFDFN
ncbi:MAG TPA: energy transducer TonB [Candidatus Acidoferrum sp.]|nr:energy transducer TonB [Candidatus Acidoferrum sp.]